MQFKTPIKYKWILTPHEFNQILCFFLCHLDDTYNHFDNWIDNFLPNSYGSRDNRLVPYYIKKIEVKKLKPT